MKRLRKNNNNHHKMIAVRVAFHPQPVVNYSLHINDYTQKEIEQTWYSKTELKEMKLQCRTILEEEQQDYSTLIVADDDDDTSDHTKPKKISSSSSRILSLIDSSEDDNNSKENYSPNTTTTTTKSNDCFRGLEGKTMEGLIKKRMLKAHARDAVFQEQDRQWELGTSDPEKIANIYRKSTEIARTSARLLGLRDAKESKSSLASQQQQQQRRVGLSPLGGGCNPFTSFSNNPLFSFATKWQGYDKQTRATPP